jgi:crotonobetaine/carnitine-CoA ligase
MAIRSLRELEGAARTIPSALLDRARLGAKPFLAAAGGTCTYEEAPVFASRWAGSLASAGIGPGDRVAVMGANSIDFLGLWLGCAWRGAVLVPVNVDLRAAQLRHVLSDSGARLLAVDATRAEHVRALGDRPATLERIWLMDDGVPIAPAELEESCPGPGDEIGPHPTGPGDTCAILYTSGTTGAPKGVCCPQAQSIWWGVNVAELLGITADDVLYTCLPLFHTNALNAPFHALSAGASLVVGERFSASRFWRRVADSDATLTYLLGVMVQILSDRQEEPGDGAHSVRKALAPGTAGSLIAPFKARFGVDLVDAYGATETNAAIVGQPGAPAGSMGSVAPGFRAMVVDENDEEVADGTPGELVLRSDEPFSFATGYYRNPEATVEAWRNLWHHTGDQVVRDADGWFVFKQRLNDRIRRRGENVSAWEVEQVLESHPTVALAAVIGVPSELGEEDVMAFVVPSDGVPVEPAELVEHCRPLLARFALPRFVEIVDSLPLTTTGKVEKYRLRTQLPTTTTWDRELEEARAASMGEESRS